MSDAASENEAEYRKALQRIDGLMHARHGTPKGERLAHLVARVEAWEQVHYPVEKLKQ